MNITNDELNDLLNGAWIDGFTAGKIEGIEEGYWRAYKKLMV